MTILLLYKIGITVLAVLGLSFVAEKISARLAGLLSGYPIGTAIILHFYGLEYGPRFAADAAIYNLCGLFASQCFAYTYYKVTQRSSSLFWASALALAGYLLPALIVSQMNPTRLTALALALIVTSLFCILLRNNTVERVAPPKAWSFRLVVSRLFFTASLVLLVTEFADIVGPSWAGIFSAFPVALYPLVFLLHRENGPETVRTLLSNFPYGLWSVIAYALSVSFFYPRYGVIWGTLLGFSMATLVLAVVSIKPLLRHWQSLRQRPA